ncbi:hypothetical protein EMCRGX_G003505 [Ephydatia muelleri]
MALQLAVFVLVSILLQQSAQGKYVESEKGPNEYCVYTYSASQTTMMSGSQSNLDMRSSIEVNLESVGKYNEQSASKYCFQVKDTSVFVEDETQSMSEASAAASQLLSESFCFIQSIEGKILSVQYSPADNREVVNIKKGIAAAFQANFKKTEVEVEQDIQSKHYAHYSYETIAPDHVIMHRTVDSENVIQYASAELNEKPISIQRVEDIEYNKGKLLKSAGTTSVNANGPVQSQGINHFEGEGDVMAENNPDTYDATFGSDGLSATGKYSLTLEHCVQKSKNVRRSSQQLTMSETSLAHLFNQEERDYIEMGRLRDSLPSVKKSLLILHRNLTDTLTSNMVKKLLMLESVHGPLPGYQPAVFDVMDYLRSLSISTKEEDIEMRVLLYSFLAAEASLKSQETLVQAISTTNNRKERNSLTVQLAFIRSVHPKVLSEIENIIKSDNDSTDPLILSYGALASSASPELQHRIVEFLKSQMDQQDDHSKLIHLIHSLGNTESSTMERAIIQLLGHDNPSVRLAAVYALRYRVSSKDVQYALSLALHGNPDPDFVEMVLRTLSAGAESQQLTEVQPIDDSLFEAVLQHTRNNTELLAKLSYYVKMLGPKAPNKWMVTLMDTHHKRATTWNENNDLYNLVSDLKTRNSDLSTYPTNKGYIWSKSLGVTSIRLDLAFGAFAGFGGSANPLSYKLFARGVAQGYAFGYTKTAFDALVSSVNAPGVNSIQNRLYVSLVGKVLVDYSREIPTCKSWSYPLYKSPTYVLLQFTYTIPIYVGSVNFGITISANLGIAATLTACINNCVQAKGAIVPTITVTATGSATASLAYLVQGGVDLKGTFQYNATPDLTGGYVLFKGPFKFCINLTHGWPNNSLSLYTYYQTRRWDWSWGDKNKWDAASKDWSLPSWGPATLWSSCDSATLQCQPIGKKH